MSDSRSGIAELINTVSVELRAVSNRLALGVATPKELVECGHLLVVLADTLRLYAEKMPNSKPSGRHSLREPTPPDG